jgi:hypothetical protein
MARELKFAMTVDSAALLQVNPKEFYTQALLANRSSAEFRQVLNIKEKTKIGSLSFGTLMFPAECDYQGGNSTLGAKEMDVCKAQIGTEVCMYEMETSFLADWMNSGSNGDWMPANFASFFFEQLGRTVSDKLEVLTWQGDTSVTFDEADPATFIGICDGLEKQLCGATIPTAQNITGTTVTSSNVIAELTKVYNQIPQAVRQNKADVKWFVSQNIADAYLLAVAVQSAEQYTNKEPELKFLGFTLSIGTGMSDNVQTVSLGTNYIFLADMVSDPEDLNVIDMSKTNGDKKWRVRSDFKVGFNYLNDSEWVVYGLDCAS